MYAILIGILVFAVQLFLCFKLKNLFIKLIPSILFAISAIALYFITQEFANNTTGWEGLGAIGYVALMIYALIGVGICILGLIVAGIIKAIKNKKKSSSHSDEQ